MGGSGRGKRTRKGLEKEEEDSSHTSTPPDGTRRVVEGARRARCHIIVECFYEPIRESRPRGNEERSSLQYQEHISESRGGSREKMSDGEKGFQ